MPTLVLGVIRCHMAGGSAQRYRDFWLVQEERWGQALIAAGTNGLSPVRNEYATAPIFHIPPSPDATTYARRKCPTNVWGRSLLPSYQMKIL